MLNGLTKLSKGVALDIDGVLLKGGKVLNRSPQAIQRLYAAKIPFVFVTNGGGIKEADKCREISEKLAFKARPEQVILSHSPFKDLVKLYHDKRVLVLGKDECRDVAHSYGFSRVATIRDIHEENPTVYPLRTPQQPSNGSSRAEHIHAAMIFHDPTDWGLDMQVLFDALVGHVPSETAKLIPDIEHEVLRQRIPLYASNADIVYKSDHPFPRFTQGAFVESFRALFELHTGSKLNVEYCGKPFPRQYEAAVAQLIQEAVLLGNHPPTRYYGVGDNPKSDIRGANAAGEDWTSILVRTGVFRGKDNDAEDPADFVCEDILDAVEYIISDSVQ